MRIKITADSTCDLSPELIAKHQIDITPLYIVRDGVSYRDGIEIKPQDIFDSTEKGGRVCQTAAINIADYIRYFEPLSQQYDAVIHINIGSEFSSCYQNAVVAADEFSNVFPIDSQNLTAGIGYLVLEAALMAESGMSPADICDRLNHLVPKMETSFILDKLDYLRRGGRCSSVAALGANLLSLKPCIEVKEGKMHVGKKFRGQFERCVLQYVQQRLTDRSDISYERLFIVHTTASPDLLAAIEKEARKLGDFKEVITTQAGCTISSHCGPNTVGIVFARRQ